jgi:hypothetical protein
MALVVLLRGIDVGGHRVFRPTLLAPALGASDVINTRLEAKHSFDTLLSAAGIVRFVKLLSRSGRRPSSMPITIPHEQDWFVRVTTLTNRHAVGKYRRHMKMIGYLGQLDALIGTRIATRSCNTVNAILRTRKDELGTVQMVRARRLRRRVPSGRVHANCLGRGAQLHAASTQLALTSPAAELDKMQSLADIIRSGTMAEPTIRRSD